MTEKIITSKFNKGKRHKKKNTWIKIFILVVVLGSILFGVLFYFNSTKWLENKTKKDSVLILRELNVPKKISDNIVVFGNPKSNKVIINAQGGPILKLNNLELKIILGYETGINPDDFFVVNVHQCQTLKTEFYTKNEINFEEAKKCDEKTVSTLAEVVKYFKDQGKTVNVLGISFGAFVVEDLLADYNNIADKYIIEVGRLDMPKEVWEKFATGSYVGFEYDENGKVRIIPFDAKKAGMGGGGSIGDKNTMRIAAGLGYKRFTELLKDKKLDNVFYAYGETDEQVGKLNEKEIEFLKSKNVKLYNIKGDHSKTIDTFSKDFLKEVLK
jgi:hypothetical protein